MASNYEPCWAVCGEMRCVLPKGHDGQHDDELPPDPPQASNPVNEALDKWSASAKAHWNALKVYGRHPVNHEREATLIEEIVKDIRRALQDETSGECPECEGSGESTINYNDGTQSSTSDPACSECKGTGRYSPAVDAARYRHLRRCEAEMGPREEQAFGEMWLKISHKGYDGKRMDSAVDEGIAAFKQATLQDAGEASTEKTPEQGPL